MEKILKSTKDRIRLPLLSVSRKPELESRVVRRVSPETGESFFVFIFFEGGKWRKNGAQKSSKAIQPFVGTYLKPFQTCLNWCICLAERASWCNNSLALWIREKGHAQTHNQFPALHLICDWYKRHRWRPSWKEEQERKIQWAPLISLYFCTFVGELRVMTINFDFTKEVSDHGRSIINDK